MKDSHTQTQPSDDTLARLLKLAGPRPEPSQAVRSEVYEGVHRAWLSRTRRNATRRRLLQSAVAASLIAVVAVALWPSRTPEPVFAGPVAQLDRGMLQVGSDTGWRIAQAGETLRVAQVRTESERAGLVLVNGISLRLDRDTQLELASPENIVLTRGRVYVDTGEQPGGGIGIETAAGVVRDIGTQFEVGVDSGQTRIRVRDGAVMLETQTDEFTASRGQALLLAADGRVERAIVASTGSSWDWVLEVAPHFDTDGRLVSDLVAWAARETGRELRYADARTRNAAAVTRIRGSVSGRSPEHTLSLALETTRFTYHLEDEVLSIDKQR